MKDLVRRRADVLGLFAALVVVAFTSRSTGVLGLGLVTGALYSLNAVAVVLVFRSNRIINFAQVIVGSVGATLFAALVTFDPLLRLGQAVCGTCLDPVPSWYRPVSFTLFAAAGLALSVGLSWLLYRFVVRRFDTAPRLIVTVCTLFVVSGCGWLMRYLSDASWLRSAAQIRAKVTAQTPVPPWTVTFHLGSVAFHAPDLLVVVVVAVLIPLLVQYFSRSGTGVAIRAAAENPNRVGSLGVDVTAVVSRVWLIAGFLSGMAAVLSAMSSGPPPPTSGIDVELITRILAVALLARFASLGITVLAAVTYGLVQETVVFNTGSALPLDAATVLVVGAVLLLQRSDTTRAGTEAAQSMRLTREVRPIPSQLRSLPEVTKWLRIGGTTTAVLLLGSPWVFSPSQTSLASYAIIATMLFVSLLVLTGWAGQISLGQLAFAAIGAWVTTVSGWPLPLAVAAGSVAAGAAAVVVGIPALKLRGLHLAIMTLAFSLSVSTLLLNTRYLGRHLPSAIARPSVLGMNLDDERVFYYTLLVLLALVVGAVAGLRRSALARALIAARDNEPAAQGFGISLMRVRLAAFAVSGMIAGFAGSLLAYQQHAVLPESFGANQSLTIFLFAVVGGMGSVVAPLVAGATFAVLTLFVPQTYRDLLLGFGGVVVLLLTQGGIAEVGFALRDNLLRGVARRRKIVVPSLLADEQEGGPARLAIQAKRRPGGGTAFVPRRYRLDDQYGIPAPVADTTTGEVVMSGG